MIMENQCSFKSFFLILVVLLLSGPATGQEWVLNKEEAGIAIYTREGEHPKIKEYRAETVINRPMEMICHEIVDFENYVEWAGDMKHIEVLDSVKGEQYTYYLIYDVPWPFSDRDMVARATVERDSAANSFYIESVPVEDRLEDRDKIVRIEDFYQKWTLTSLGDEVTRVVMEGYNDPAGNIPAWLVNWGAVDTPFDLLKSLKLRVEKDLAQ